MAGDAEVAQTLDRVLTDLAVSRNYNDWLFSRVRPFLGQRVLDAGAGIGTFTELAAAIGASVVALEPDPAFARSLRDRFASNDSVEVLESGAEAVRAMLGPFDSVLCLNVLEHVEDDEAALHGFREALCPGGRLLLLVPAHAALYGGYDRAAGHLRRYAKGDIRGALGKAGFEVETLRHVNPIGAAGWLARVRLRGGEDWPSTSFRTFDRLVPALKHLDALRLPVGLSLWAVARRPRADG